MSNMSKLKNITYYPTGNHVLSY